MCKPYVRLSQAEGDFKFVLSETLRRFLLLSYLRASNKG
jgi:hypothetical protein